MNATLIRNLYTEELYNLAPKAIVVVSKPWEDHSPEETALLVKILGSVKLGLSAVQIIARPALSLDSLAVYGATRILVFGSALDQEVKPYENHARQGFSVIKADTLEALDDVRKRNLWLALRNMFGV